ncbi:glycosyltransferase family 2 protein [Salinisphaera sp. P385]|uniref:Glycosyltransferase family 2 protein n=1 Tax=Spectribacter acetivorans TaxID=3075603 RepID=A0ABU3BBD5_9GAMM|nr:glycosyltransferase family 2 protein [Salinisphaera sp. P385]MDT0619794.1 glycosyltransferase family 2 protein [Salinisphaera sp. P385]
MNHVTSTADDTAREERGPVLSIVVPVLNEEKAIEPFLDRTVASLEATAKLHPSVCNSYEIVFVDDGSTDATVAAVIAARQRFGDIRLVMLSRSFGKDAALSAGLEFARGAAVIPIDVDLQDPPELFSSLVGKWLDGAKVVNAIRRDRKRESFGKRFTAAAFYRAYNILAERPIPREAGDFRLLDRDVVDTLKRLPERIRFMKGLVSWAGFPASEVYYDRDERVSGRSRWRFWQLWNFALDGITSSTTTPLRIWTYFGGAMAFLAFGYALFIVSTTLLLGRATPGYASLITVVLILGGLNLVALGILGEYIGRIFNEVKGRPLYVVSSTVGFDDIRQPSTDVT